MMRTEVLKKIAAFPELPALCGYVLRHCNDPNVDFAGIARELRYDPGITANILKLANSAYFGVVRRVDSVQTAISLLGLQRVSDMVISGVVADRMLESLSGYNLAGHELLNHSICVAVAAEEFCDFLAIKNTEAVFTCGLLHDIGKLIMDDFVIQEQQRLMKTASNEGCGFDGAEDLILGMNHAAAGAELLDSWSFPSALVEVVRWHHRPLQAEKSVQTVASLIHMSDMLAYAEGIGAGIDGFLYHVYEDSIAHQKLKKKDLEVVASRAFDKVRELNAVFAGERRGA